jgi:DNA-binding transcriptional LysR family regulator
MHRGSPLLEMAVRWLDLDLRHLATFRVLAEERSFRATARRLGFAQSGISRHIATLEQRVGAKLVTRGNSGHPFELTAEGKVLLEHAEAILSVVAVAERDFTHRNRRSATGLRIGSFQSVSATLLAAAVARAKQDNPTLAIDLLDTDRPIDLLRSGDVDLAFSETVPTDPLIAYLELMLDPYVVLSHNGTLPGNSAEVTLDELSRLPLMTYRNSCHLAEVEKELGELGVFLRPIIRNDDALTLQSLATTGAGVALLPQLAVTPTTVLHSRAVDRALRPRRICLLWNAQPAPSIQVRKFAETIRLCASGLQQVAEQSRRARTVSGGAR